MSSPGGNPPEPREPAAAGPAGGSHDHVPPLDQYVHHEYESTRPTQRAEPEKLDFLAARDSEEFANLRSKFRSFAFPMTVAFIVWYFAYVLMSSFAVDFMSTPVLGTLNVGLIWGLAQFATTFLLTFLYIRHANKNLDPLSRAMRQDFAKREGKI